MRIILTTPTQWLSAHVGRRIIPIAVALALIAALVPAQASAKPVKSSVDIDIFGVIDRHSAIAYFLSGSVFAKRLTFRCMADRKVVLFRQQPDGTSVRVLSTRTDFLGEVFAPLEIRLDDIPGYYFAKVKRRTRSSRHGKLNCLAARSPTILVEVPPALLHGSGNQ